jgi:hypothetical protein
VTEEQLLSLVCVHGLLIVRKPVEKQGWKPESEWIKFCVLQIKRNVCGSEGLVLKNNACICCH